MPRDYTVLHAGECADCGKAVRDDLDLDANLRCSECADTLKAEENAFDLAFDEDNAEFTRIPDPYYVRETVRVLDMGRVVNHPRPFTPGRDADLNQEKA